ncbi:hypothetical protein J6590_070786 [Homalodisca vitripennis]|nr:hypothetical protein J6590_070786 [Homalodisca vitripennis]
MIRSYKHDLYSVELNKIVLSAHDDKRYIQDDGIGTLPWGHYNIPEEVMAELEIRSALSTHPHVALCGRNCCSDIQLDLYIVSGPVSAGGVQMRVNHDDGVPRFKFVHVDIHVRIRFREPKQRRTMFFQVPGDSYPCPSLRRRRNEYQSGFSRRLGKRRVPTPIRGRRTYTDTMIW